MDVLVVTTKKKLKRVMVPPYRRSLLRFDIMRSLPHENSVTRNGPATVFRHSALRKIFVSNFQELNVNQVLDHNILLQATGRRTRLGGTDPCQFCFDHLHLCLLHPFHSHSKQRYTHAYRHTSIHPTACTIDFDITNII